MRNEDDEHDQGATCGRAPVTNQLAFEQHRFYPELQPKRAKPIPPCHRPACWDREDERRTSGQPQEPPTASIWERSDWGFGGTGTKRLRAVLTEFPTELQTQTATT